MPDFVLQAFQTFVSVLPMLQSFVDLSQVKVIVYIDESKFWTTMDYKLSPIDPIFF